MGTMTRVNNHTYPSLVCLPTFNNHSAAWPSRQVLHTLLHSQCRRPSHQPRQISSTLYLLKQGLSSPTHSSSNRDNTSSPQPPIPIITRLPLLRLPQGGVSMYRQQVHLQLCSTRDSFRLRHPTVRIVRGPTTATSPPHISNSQPTDIQSGTINMATKTPMILNSNPITITRLKTIMVHPPIIRNRRSPSIGSLEAPGPTQTIANFLFIIYVIYSSSLLNKSCSYF